MLRRFASTFTVRSAAHATFSVIVFATFVSFAATPAAQQQQQPPQRPFEPTVGQAGKDVVWVPTPAELVEKMLDLAKVTAQDVVVDLGSGDGRNIIAAAKRGARARGVEFNPDMVELSNRLAKEAGVAGKAVFVQGDMFTADFSDATVMALFLLPDNLTKLRDKFAALKPGTRIVVNTFGIEEWEPEVTEQISGECQSWCTAMLYIVPAKVAGTWQLPQGQLMINQTAQRISGTVTMNGKAVSFSNGKVLGDQISFSVAGAEYRGRVNGTRIEGVTIAGSGKQTWTATRGN